MDRWIGGFNVRSALLCEGIRVELGNKVLVYGIYSGDILLPSFPQQIPLTVYLELRDAKPGTHPVGMRIRLNDTLIAEAHGEVTVAGRGPTAVPLPILPVALMEPGALHLDIDVDGEGWEPLIDRGVSLIPA